MDEALIIWFVIFCAGAYVSAVFLPEPWKKLCAAVFGIGALVIAVKVLLLIL